MGETNAGRAAALCTVVATRGSTPQPPGAMLCVDGNAQITGTLGGGCVEAEVRRRAHELLTAGRSAVLTFELDHDFGYDDGMICGGQMDVAVSVYSSSSDAAALRAAHARLVAGEAAVLPIRVEKAGRFAEYRVHLEAMPELIIAGGGHISRILAPWMASLGFHVSVIDDRSEYANAKRFPSPIRPIATDIAGTLKNWAIGPNTYVVIVTRGHKHDEAALQAVLGSRAKYIGMIGSRRKVRVILDDLLHRGATPEQLDRVHAPIGLDIGAVTAEEIAISIAAQLVSIRRQERGFASRGSGGSSKFKVQSSKRPFELRTSNFEIPPDPRSLVWGIVPAAGLGRRMGRLKQSLPYGDSTMAGTVVRTLLDAGVDRVVVVTRSDLQAQLGPPQDPRIHVAINDNAETEMIDSIRIGLDAVADSVCIPESLSPPGGEGRVRGFQDALPTSQGAQSTIAPAGIAVLPADMPTATVQSVRICLASFRETPGAIVIAACAGKRGHPIIFPWAMRDVVRNLRGGLRQLPTLHADLVRLVETGDPGVTRDVDTPDDYQRLVNRSPL